LAVVVLLGVLLPPQPGNVIATRTVPTAKGPAFIARSLAVRAVLTTARAGKDHQDRILHRPRTGAGHGAALVLYPPTFDPAWIAHDAPLLATY
jgi:hypothetical protein